MALERCKSYDIDNMALTYYNMDLPCFHLSNGTIKVDYKFNSIIVDRYIDCTSYTSMNPSAEEVIEAIKKGDCIFYVTNRTHFKNNNTIKTYWTFVVKNCMNSDKNPGGSYVAYLKR